MTELSRTVLCLLAVCQIVPSQGQAGQEAPVQRRNGMTRINTTYETNTDDKVPRVIFCGELTKGTKIVYKDGPQRDAYRSRFPWTVALGYSYRPPVKPNDSLQSDSLQPTEPALVTNFTYIPYVAHWARTGPNDPPPPNVTDLVWRCGGSLVSPLSVITAAHCIVDNSGYVLVVARLGDVNLDDTVDDGTTPMDYEVESWIAHPEYNESSHVNDIAVVKLKHEITFTDDIKPICLPTTNMFRTYDFSGWYAEISGWGTTEYGGPKSDSLTNGRVRIVSQEVCRETYAVLKDAVIDHRVVCAGDNQGMDACQYDSGGPLAVIIPGLDTFYLFGVVSFGLRCGEVPGVNTRVPEFMDFILQTM